MSALCPNPATFAAACDPTWRQTFHQRTIGAIIADRLNKGGARLIINMPPRHGKSRLCAVETPLWWMAQRPKTEVVYATYSLDLAARHSREARDRFDSERFLRLTNLRLSSEVSQYDYWKTKCGSSYKAVGVGGSLTGHGADLLILDDLHKDAAEAASETMRDRVWDWLKSVALTRLAPNASIILIGTRWHKDDVTGRIIENFPTQWEVVNLPAVAGNNDLFRLPGEALWPDKFPLAELKKIETTIGKYFWAALYSGRPVAIQGNYVDPEKIHVHDLADLPPDLRMIRFWDLATSEDQSSDFTAGGLCGIQRTGDFWIVDIRRGQWEWPRARGTICHAAAIDRCQVGVEAVGGFKTAYSNLLEVFPMDIPLGSYHADKDKLTRALPWFAAVNDGRVHMIRGPWNLDFVSELAAFPMGDNDDQVDCISGAYNALKPPVGPSALPTPFTTGRRAMALAARRNREVTA